MIEVELRGFLTLIEHAALIEKFSTELEEDHRETIFFTTPNATLKVASMISQQAAKIAYKEGEIATSRAQREYEISIMPSQIDCIVDIFTALGHGPTQITKQDRWNIKRADWELALKWSEDWGHHFEIEKMVNSVDEVSAATHQLESVCKDLGLSPITENAFVAFCEEIEKKHQSRRMSAAKQRS